MEKTSSLCQKNSEPEDDVETIIAEQSSNKSRTKKEIITKTTAQPMYGPNLFENQVRTINRPKPVHDIIANTAIMCGIAAILYLLFLVF